MEFFPHINTMRLFQAKLFEDLFNMLELKEIIDNAMSLPLDKKAYLAEILIKEIETERMEPPEIPMKRTFGEYVGKIEMSDDFNVPLPDEFWSGEL